MRSQYKEKGELILKLYQDKGSDACNHVVELAEYLIAEVREANDIASIDEIRYNQGKIEGFKTIISAILVGLPNRLSNK